MSTSEAHENESLFRRTLRLLERQRDALRRVASLAEQQGALIEREETDALLAVMGQRQVALQEAASAGEEIVALRSGGPAEGGAPADVAAQIGRVRQEIDALVREIGERDESDRRTLEQKRERVLKEMSGVAKGREAAAAYGSRDRSPRYQDREG